MVKGFNICLLSIEKIDLTLSYADVKLHLCACILLAVISLCVYYDLCAMEQGAG